MTTMFFCCWSVHGSLSTFASAMTVARSLPFHASVFPLLSLPISTSFRRCKPDPPPNYTTPRRILFRQDATEMRCNKRGDKETEHLHFWRNVSFHVPLFRVLHCTCEGRPPAAERSSSPGIMSHNVMLRSDWHGERH